MNTADLLEDMAVCIFAYNKLQEIEKYIDEHEELNRDALLDILKAGTETDGII